MQAVSARFRCVARIDVHDADAFALGLILDELLQLVECPRVETSALSLAESATVADTFERFKDNRQAVVAGEHYQLLTDFVVDLFLVATFPTRKPFERPATSLSGLLVAGVCLRLQAGPHVGAVLAIVGQVFTLKLMSYGITSDRAETQVNAKRVFSVLGRWRVFFDLNIQVIGAPLAREGSRLRGLSGQSFALKVAQLHGEDAAPVEQADGNGFGFNVELENAGVVVNRGGLESAVSRFGVGQSGRDPCNGADGQVGTETELFAHVAVAALVQVVLAMALVVIAPIGDEVASVGKRRHRRVDALSHPRGNDEFARESAYRFHVFEYGELYFTT